MPPIDTKPITIPMPGVLVLSRERPAQVFPKETPQSLKFSEGYGTLQEFLTKLNGKHPLHCSTISRCIIVNMRDAPRCIHWAIWETFPEQLGMMFHERSNVAVNQHAIVLGRLDFTADGLAYGVVIEPGETAPVLPLSAADRRQNAQG